MNIYMQNIFFLSQSSTDIDEHNVSSVCDNKDVELKIGKISQFRTLPYLWQKMKIIKKYVAYTTTNRMIIHWLFFQIHDTILFSTTRTHFLIWTRFNTWKKYLFSHIYLFFTPTVSQYVNVKTYSYFTILVFANVNFIVKSFFVNNVLCTKIIIQAISFDLITNTPAQKGHWI